MTTTELRTRGFEILIAPGVDGSAAGELYLDDGESIEVERAAEIRFTYRDGKLKIGGRFGYHPTVAIEAVTVLGRDVPSKAQRGVAYDAVRRSVTKKVEIKLTGPAEVDV
jgi:alpha-glucosidase